jgi:hypothetical protein
MAPEPLLYGVAFVVVALYLGAILYARHRALSGGASTIALSGGRQHPPPETDRDIEDPVVCDHCGADNEAGFRRCWHCIEELPGDSLVTGTDTTSDGVLP